MTSVYKENLIRISIKVSIGFVVAFYAMTQIEPDGNFSSWCIMAFFFSTVVQGWSTINQYSGSWFVTGSAAAFVLSLLAKLLLSLLVGWIVTPIALIYNTVRLIMEQKQNQQI